MSTALVVGFTLCLAALIVVCEARRQPDILALDFMRMASVIWFLAYVVLPLYVTFVDLRAFTERMFDWMFKHPFGSEAFAIAAGLALAAYALMAMGYAAATARARRRAARRGEDLVRATSVFAPVTPRYLMGTGLLLGVFGTTALVLYIRDLGGVLIFLVSGVAARSGEPPVESPLAFLKSLSLVVLGASYCFYALLKDERAGRLRRSAWLPFLVTGALSVAVLFHYAGRVFLMTYFLAFAVAGAIRRGGVRPRTALVGGVAFVALILFGRQLFTAVANPTSLLTQAERLQDDGLLTLNLFLLEFVFPVVTSANTVVSVPELSPFRWFVDVPLGVLYLVPQRLLGVRHPPTASMVNTELLDPSAGGIPVDIVSLGYFSAGVVGVVVVAWGFGWLLSAFERALPPGRDPLPAVFRASWMFFLAFRVMYADPQHATSSGFYLLLTTGLLVLPQLRVTLAGMLARHAARAP